MVSDVKKTRLIYPPNQHLGRYFTVAVAVLILIVFFLILWNPHINAVPAIITLFITGGLGLYLARMLDKPHLSFSLSDTHFQHHTSKGGWSTKWHDIHRIGIPTVSQEGWHQDLPWVGIRLKHYECFLDSISFRLASHIIMDQRGLLLSAYRRAEEPIESQLEDMMFDDSPFISPHGKTYSGLIAMLANRMSYNRELLGYDVFVSEDLLDRSLEDFVGLTRQYLASAGKVTPAD